jgi:hypothetical protein
MPTGGAGLRGWASATYNAVISPIAAGTNVIGKVGIDQTTPGTTNAVAVTGTVPLPTGAATSANQPSNVSQGAAIGSLTGHLMMAETLTSDPTPSTATVNPLYTDGFGHLRTSQGTVTINMTPTVTSNGTYAANRVLGTLVGSSYGVSSGTIVSIHVTSQSIISQNLIAVIFWQQPISSTWTDNTVPAIVTADKSRVLEAVPLTAPSSVLGTHTVWSAPVGVTLSSNSFWVILIAGGAFTLTSGTPSDIVIRVTMRF